MIVIGTGVSFYDLTRSSSYCLLRMCLGKFVSTTVVYTD